MEAVLLNSAVASRINVYDLYCSTEYFYDSAGSSQADYFPNNEHAWREQAGAFRLGNNRADSALPDLLVRLPCCPYNCNLQHATCSCPLFTTFQHPQAHQYALPAVCLYMEGHVQKLLIVLTVR